MIVATVAVGGIGSQVPRILLETATADRREAIGASRHPG